MVAVVIPCYRVRSHILDVIARIGPEVTAIYVVDDACPEHSGRYVEENCADPRLRVIFHKTNQGVGGAVITGYKQAVADGAGVIVKIDGDGQMNPVLIPHFIAPILSGEADYTKGNRFYEPGTARAMPLIRVFGNSLLSFACKMSTGYWSIFDPTNGYTAIHANVVQALPLERLARRWFFESDLLFRLGTLSCRLVDIPMAAVYSNEVSNLREGRVVLEFLTGHARNTAKRIFYQYFLRNFGVATLELIFGSAFFAFGLVFGAWEWYTKASAGVFASSGQVMLAALPMILGVQLLLAFLAQDIAGQPTVAIHNRLAAIVELRRQAQPLTEAARADRNAVSPKDAESRSMVSIPPES
jgi:glycosyltransferase involved in cell wall biosynthesis